MSLHYLVKHEWPKNQRNSPCSTKKPTRTTRVAFWDPPSGSQNESETGIFRFRWHTAENLTHPCILSTLLLSGLLPLCAAISKLVYRYQEYAFFVFCFSITAATAEIARVVGWSVVSVYYDYCVLIFCHFFRVTAATTAQTLLVYRQKLKSLGYISAANIRSLSSLIPMQLAPKTWRFHPRKCRLRHNGYSRSSKVIDFNRNRTLVCDFLLV